MARNGQTRLVEMRDISISFGGIKAVGQEPIDLYPGEVVGLPGHNGAGKSTPIKCLSGAYQADAGQILIMDEPTAALGPHETQMVAELIQELKSQGLGIFLIEQDIHSVMKNGQHVGTVKVDEVTDDDILGMIILGKKPAHLAA